MQPLSDLFRINRRYIRSTNLERDFSNPESVEGYIPSGRTVDLIERIFSSFERENSHRAWTITGPYGTGKSSFAHLVSCLTAPSQSPIRKKAVQVLSSSDAYTPSLQNLLVSSSESNGLVRAIATAGNEPISLTILRALRRGVDDFWATAKGRKPAVIAQLTELEAKASDVDVEPKRVLELVREVALASKTGLLLIVDELGKNLEYSAQNPYSGDLYIVQQLAELPAGAKDPRVFFIGLLHQAFSEYAHSLSQAERKEWGKVQGRFEDVPFSASASEMVNLVGHAIDSKLTKSINSKVEKLANDWHSVLTKAQVTSFSDSEMIQRIYPLHPLTALLLPIICSKYAQNDRSMFSFLTSEEPHSLLEFLRRTNLNGALPASLKLAHLYDYFVDAVGSGLYSRPQLQRWIEIQGRIAEANNLSPEQTSALKSIGMLNLAASSGSLRASKRLVCLSLIDDPVSKQENKRVNQVIDQLISLGHVTYRRQADELRIWQGSDFDIDSAIETAIQEENRETYELLRSSLPLRPIVAQRHSYQKGTLRYFAAHYVSSFDELGELEAEDPTADGIIAYWVNSIEPSDVPDLTPGGKPLVVLESRNLSKLSRAVFELAALRKIAKNAPELRTDGVARKEVRHRLHYATNVLQMNLSACFDYSETNIWSQGNQVVIDTVAEFKAHLSEVCDSVYCDSPVLWNELINRRELTSQGSKARREVIEAMILNGHQERLGFEGNGPETSIYASVLGSTGIHRCKQGEWLFSAPSEPGLVPIWNAIKDFSFGAVKAPKSIDELYAHLAHRPIGAKSGIIPVLFAAFILTHSEEVCIYKDGSFIPVVGPEHFELLVKNPARFAIKYFSTSGLRAQVFKQLEDLLVRQDARSIQSSARNTSLLAVVKPLVQFSRKLPDYTKQTKFVSIPSVKVRNALANAKEPDELLFNDIPRALGLDAISVDKKANEAEAHALRERLLESLRELQLCYDNLLSECKSLLVAAFKAEEATLRSALQARCERLKFICAKSRFESFIINAVEDEIDDRTWLERILMVIADKPVEAWTDIDKSLFDTKLGDFARHFRNFEALQKDLQESPGDNFEATRITVTHPSGRETNKVVWLDKAKTSEVDRLVSEILEEKLTRGELREAVLSKLAERILTT